MPESGYVLQLLGARSEQGARDFVAQYGARLPMTYYQTELKSKPWYVVVAGPYQDRSAALRAIKQLPTGLQKQKPWARSVLDVQVQIRAYRQQ